MKIVHHKSLDFRHGAHALRARQPDQEHVIDVSCIMPDLQLSFYEVIDRVEVDQRIELAQQVADRNPDRIVILREPHHARDQAAVLDLPFDQFPKDIAVDRIKELLHIDMQGVVIATVSAHCILDIVRASMCPLADPASERCVNECAVEQRVYPAVYGMLNHTITERRGKNHAAFRFENDKPVVWLRSV